jgi:hypothetical protein
MKWKGRRREGRKGTIPFGRLGFSTSLTLSLVVFNTLNKYNLYFVFYVILFCFVLFYFIYTL